MAFMIGDAATPEELSLAQSCMQLWNSSQQQQAVDQLRPKASENVRWAVALTCWFQMQMMGSGTPVADQALDSASQAVQLGMPWCAINVINNAIANSQALPHIVEPAVKLLSEISPVQPAGVDPTSNGWNLLTQGQGEQGLRLLGSYAIEGPHSDDSWQQLSTQLNDRVREISELALSGVAARERLDQEVETVIGQIQRRRDDVETSAKQANMLVTSVLSESVNELFKEDARTSKSESDKAWKWGLGVLSAAAAIAVSPLLLHYIGFGDSIKGSAVLAAHAASAAAFATVAGVLLARARSRDKARQRANDLSTAMGTMISYSNQIENPTEKQAFMLTMGQLVLQAHLTGGTSSADDSGPGLVSLANAMRQSNGSQ